MEPKIVACHQPNFLPWMGYFAKMFHSDIFILLDDAQFTQGHNKHNWTTRVQILTSSGPLWLSVPVKRSGKGKQLIRDVQINTSDTRWLRKILQTIEQNYIKTPYFQKYYPELEDIIERSYTNIAELNFQLIEWFVKQLEMKTKIYLSSDYSVSTSSNQRLIDLTTAVGGNIYLSGDGADEYQLEEEFRKNGIELQKMEFKHPIYSQHKRTDFIPGISIIDAIFNIGAEETNTLLAGSRHY